MSHRTGSTSPDAASGTVPDDEGRRGVTYLILFILAVVWAVYLFSWIRTRTEASRTNSISTFSRHMSTLERATPRTGLSIAPQARAFPGTNSFRPVRPSMSLVKQRRRNVLFGLLGATGFTFLGALGVGGLLTTLFVLSLAATGGYVLLLANAQKRVLERRTKVRQLPGTPAVRSQSVDFFADDRADLVGQSAYDAFDTYDTYAEPVRRVQVVNGR